MKIHAPNRDLTGEQTYGTTVIKFEEGVAEVNELSPNIRQYLVGAGYGIDVDPQPTTVDDHPDPHSPAVFHIGTPLADASLAPVDPDDLTTRTVADLRGYAAEYGIDVDEAKTKAELTHAIRTHFAALPDRQDEQA